MICSIQEFVQEITNQINKLLPEQKREFADDPSLAPWRREPQVPGVAPGTEPHGDRVGKCFGCTE